MARIVLHTFGSLGDLHPYIAVARALADRGHHAVVATHDGYRERVEGSGVPFHAVRPAMSDLGDEDTVRRRAMAPDEGSRYVVRELVVPFVRASRDDLLEACAGADVLVSHALSFVAPLVAEHLRIPRVHTMLQPVSLFSAHDPSLVQGAAPWMLRLPPFAWRAFWGLAARGTRPWFAELATLRAEMGLPPSDAHPLFELHSQRLNLAMFSPVLAAPQRDWPPDTRLTGFPVHDRDGIGAGVPEALARFLDDGPAPVVFTLGSAVAFNPGDFYRAAAEAARLLGIRAVLLTGPDARHAPDRLPDGVFAAAYAPYSEVFPRAAAVVHQGGIGTTGTALRSGHPMLVVPFSHDQPDNAMRCARLGVARVVPPKQADARRLAHALKALLADEATRRRAAEVGAIVQRENGAAAAAAAIEDVLRD